MGITDNGKKLLRAFPDAYHTLDQDAVISDEMKQAASELVAQEVLNLNHGKYAITSVGRFVYHSL